MTKKEQQQHDEFTHRLNTDEGFVVGCLMRVYSHQEMHEKVSQVTTEQNGVGFNMMDANLLSSIAEWYTDKGFLTARQLEAVRTRIVKYRRQCTGVEPLPIKSRQPAPTTESAPTPTPITTTAKSVALEGDTLVVRFPYNPDTVSAVKNMPGRRWNPDRKLWTMPLSFSAVEGLLNLGFSLQGQALSDWWAGFNKVANADLSIPGLQKTLRPFQVAGVSLIDQMDGSALLADDMGLGKTVQIIGYLQLHPELRPAVVVCPATAKPGWERHILTWMEDPGLIVLNGKPGKKSTVWDHVVRKPKKHSGYIVLANYDILAYWWKLIHQDMGTPEVLALDECHNIKNPKALRTRAIVGWTEKVLDKTTWKETDVQHAGLATGCRRILATSGTPIINRPIEFWTVLHMLRPDVFPSFWHYTQHFCDAKRTDYGWNFNGHSNMDELHNLLVKTVMIRRLKTEVMPELPKKQRVVVPLELSRSAIREYTKLEVEFARNNARPGQKAPGEVLAQITALKYWSAKAKLDAATEWIRDYMSCGKKLVVFAHHHDILDGLRDELKEFNPVLLDGRVSSATAKQALIDRFQEDPDCRLFIGGLKAAGVAITLTAADSTAFVELGWTPGEHTQAEDRVLRIGQESQSVNAYYLLADQTLDMDVAELLDAKMAVLEMALDGKEVESTNLLAELLLRVGERTAKAA